MDAPALSPRDEYAGGVVVERLPGRRCAVRLADGRVVVGCVPWFARRQAYDPEPGHEVTVFLGAGRGECLLVGFPRLGLPGGVDAAEPGAAPDRGGPSL